MQLEAPPSGELDAALARARAALDQRGAEGALALGVLPAAALVGGPGQGVDDGGDAVEAPDVVVVVVALMGCAFFFSRFFDLKKSESFFFRRRRRRRRLVLFFFLPFP